MKTRITKVAPIMPNSLLDAYAKLGDRLPANIMECANSVIVSIDAFAKLDTLLSMEENDTINGKVRIMSNITHPNGAERIIYPELKDMAYLESLGEVRGHTGFFRFTLTGDFETIESLFDRFNLVSASEALNLVNCEEE